MKTRVFLTLSLFLTTLQAIRLGLTKKVISDADKKDILNVNDDDAFSKYLQMYDDIEPAILRVSSSPTVMKQVRAKQKKTFVANLKRIKKHNKKYKRGKSKYDMSINSFTMMDKENRKMFHGLNISHISNKYKMKNSVKFTVGAVGSIPSSLDWKQRGWMTGVKNQGGCGSCWTFPTTALVEFAYKASTGKMVQLSEQQMLDCTYDTIDPGYDGCDGGFYTKGWDWIVRNDHLAKMSDYTYKASDSSCSSHYYSSAMKNVMQLKGYNQVGTSENQVIQAMQMMPLAVAFQAEDNFHGVGQGIYDECQSVRSGQINHAVTLTAYTGQYWEIKNSWGADWARKGYGRLQRGRGSICNILDYVYYIQYDDLNRNDGQDPNDSDTWTEPEDTVCEDKADAECAKWNTYNYCTTGDYTEYMKLNCPATCKHCVADAGCEDSNTECPGWAKANYCEAGDYVTYMKDNCAKSCGVCGDGNSGGKCGGGLISCNGICKHKHMCKEADRDATEPTKEDKKESQCEDNNKDCQAWKNLNYCSSALYAEYMRSNCAASCNTCGSLGSCTDTNTDCPGWARDYGYCTGTVYSTYMQGNCQLSCGICA